MTISGWKAMIDFPCTCSPRTPPPSSAWAGIPIIRVGDFDIGLGFTLFVLQGTIQEEDARILNATTHFGMSGILVEHDPLEDDTVGNFSTGDLLHLGITLDIHFHGLSRFSTASRRLGTCHCQDGLQCHFYHFVIPSVGEFRANARIHNFFHLYFILNIHNFGHTFTNIQCLLKGSRVSLYNNRGVEHFCNEWLGEDEHFSSEDDDGGGTISDFFILGTRQFNHGFGSGLTDVYFA
mmetsp:Transcript_24708/g.37781  ORF Transcript_24708/g.37781 Transcript_24708/m.37781 type:complete len:236 (-) Transcript_24708:356-1063(-)